MMPVMVASEQFIILEHMHAWKKFFTYCLDLSSALNGLHATALAGHTIKNLTLQDGYLKLS